MQVQLALPSSQGASSSAIPPSEQTLPGLPPPTKPAIASSKPPLRPGLPHGARLRQCKEVLAANVSGAEVAVQHTPPCTPDRQAPATTRRDASSPQPPHPSSGTAPVPTDDPVSGDEQSMGADPSPVGTRRSALCARRRCTPSRYRIARRVSTRRRILCACSCRSWTTCAQPTQCRTSVRRSRCWRYRDTVVDARAARARIAWKHRAHTRRRWNATAAALGMLLSSTSGYTPDRRLTSGGARSGPGRAAREERAAPGDGGSAAWPSSRTTTTRTRVAVAGAEADRRCGREPPAAATA